MAVAKHKWKEFPFLLILVIHVFPNFLPTCHLYQEEGANIHESGINRKKDKITKSLSVNDCICKIKTRLRLFCDLISHQFYCKNVCTQLSQQVWENNMIARVHRSIHCTFLKFFFYYTVLLQSVLNGTFYKKKPTRFREKLCQPFSYENVWFWCRVYGVIWEWRWWTRSFLAWRTDEAAGRAPVLSPRGRFANHRAPWPYPVAGYLARTLPK